MSIFSKLEKAIAVDRESTRPIFFDLSRSSDIESLEELMDTRTPFVHDKIIGQVQELMKLRRPSEKLTEEELGLLVQEYINNNGGRKFGVWVYYPWSNKLVHILKEHDFIEVRTNRNKDKITLNEQNKLKLKKVAIVGMSVGMSIAIAIAMERVCGTLVLADFDKIELSNLNRLAAGVTNLDVSKCVFAARTISELDPYLNVELLEGGILNNSSKQFLKENSPDIVFDECDSIGVKYELRKACQELGVPIIMDTNDRGMLDVERYDIQKETLPFLGFVDESNFIDKNKSSQGRIELVKDILDWSSVSNRLRSSMSQIGKTLTSWPQLASSVMLGAGIGTYVCREILLGTQIKSGRYYVDVQSIFNLKTGEFGK